MIRKLGRRPPTFTPRQLKGGRYLKDMLVALPAPPAVSADFVTAVMKQVPKSDYPWEMEGNDSISNCTCAEESHALMLRTANTGKIVIPTTEQTIALYSAITGYNPADPGTDQGAEIGDVCAYIQAHGLLGHKSIGHVPVVTDQMGPTQITRIKQAIQIFGSVNLGVNLPASAESQFDAGQPWIVAGDLTIEGGHAVCGVKYDNNFLYVVTWGRLQPVMWSWVLKFVEEAWCEIFPDFVTAKGVTPDGFSLSQVEGYLKAIAA